VPGDHVTVRLRPHHLLCILSYVGKGYTPDFCKNYDDIIKRIQQDEAILVVDGPDDICRPLLDDEAPHCHQASVTERDNQAADVLTELTGKPVTAGMRLSMDAARIRSLRDAFAAGEIRKPCEGCEWKYLCDGIASNDFRETRLVGR